MKLILLQDIKNVGKKNQTVEVKNGYGNFLINANKAIVWSLKATEIVNKQVVADKQQHDYEVRQAILLKNKIEALTLAFRLKTNHGQAFGSVSTKQVLDQLKQNNINVDKYMLVDGNKSYGLGFHKITIKLHKEVIANLTIAVEGE